MERLFYWQRGEEGRTVGETQITVITRVWEQKRKGGAMRSKGGRFI